MGGVRGGGLATPVFFYFFQRRRFAQREKLTKTLKTPRKKIPTREFRPAPHPPNWGPPLRPPEVESCNLPFFLYIYKG